MKWTAESIRNQYSRFLDNYSNVLFANHSHQAWPNVAKFGHLKAFDMAADNHGSKWRAVEQTRKEMRQWISTWIGNDEFGGVDGITWGQNTFELVAAFLSSLNLKKGDVVITSDREFHSLRRLLQAYEERGVVVERVPLFTVEEAKEKIAGQGFFVRMGDAFKKYDAGSIKSIVFSSVSFHTGSLAGEFEEALDSLLERGIPVLVDLYHHIGPKQFKVSSIGEKNLYLVGGGYKYMQMGEGNCWMRTPSDCKLRPLNTGWFAEFSEMELSPDEFDYPSGAERFRGATYDPVSILRAKEVANFFDGIGFTPESLEEKYTSDVSKIFDRLSRLLDRLPEDYKDKTELYLLSHKDEDRRAGFVALNFRHAMTLNAFLEKHFLETDYRGDVIRFGPAPYTTDLEINKLLDLITDYFEGEV